METKKREGTALGRRRSKKRRLTQRNSGKLTLLLEKGAPYLTNNKKGGEIGDK